MIIDGLLIWLFNSSNSIADHLVVAYSVMLTPSVVSYSAQLLPSWSPAQPFPSPSNTAADVLIQVSLDSPMASDASL